MTHNRSIQPSALALTLALAAGAPQAAAPDTAAAAAPATAPATSTAGQDKVERLVSDNCIKCHGSEVYTRPDRKVTSLAGLERQVRRCETALELTWFDEDVADVAHYLNQQYYHFK